MLNWHFRNVRLKQGLCPPSYNNSVVGGFMSLFISPTPLTTACCSARTRRNTLWNGGCRSLPASSRKRKDRCHSRVHTISNLERRYAFNLYLTILLLRCYGLQYNGFYCIFNERIGLFFTKTVIKFTRQRFLFYLCGTK